MQHHYSTVATDEKRQAIAKVIDLARVRSAVAVPKTGVVCMVVCMARIAKRPLVSDSRNGHFSLGLL